MQKILNYVLLHREYLMKIGHQESQGGLNVNKISNHLPLVI